MLLRRLYRSKYDSQGPRVSPSCSESHGRVCRIPYVGQRLRGTLLGFVHIEKRSRWTWPLSRRCFAKPDDIEWPTTYWFDQGKAFFDVKTVFSFVKISSRVKKKDLEQTYDVSFSIYYQGFYDSYLFDNMTDGILEFLDSGGMNGTGRFSSRCF